MAQDESQTQKLEKSWKPKQEKGESRAAYQKRYYTSQRNFAADTSDDDTTKKIESKLPKAKRSGEQAGYAAAQDNPWQAAEDMVHDAAGAAAAGTIGFGVGGAALGLEGALKKGGAAARGVAGKAAQGVKSASSAVDRGTENVVSRVNSKVRLARIPKNHPSRQPIGTAPGDLKNKAQDLVDSDREAIKKSKSPPVNSVAKSEPKTPKASTPKKVSPKGSAAKPAKAAVKKPKYATSDNIRPSESEDPAYVKATQNVRKAWAERGKKLPGKPGKRLAKEDDGRSATAKIANKAAADFSAGKSAPKMTLTSKGKMPKKPKADKPAAPKPAPSAAPAKAPEPPKAAPAAKKEPRGFQHEVPPKARPKAGQKAANQKFKKTWKDVTGSRSKMAKTTSIKRGDRVFNPGQSQAESYVNNTKRKMAASKPSKPAPAKKPDAPKKSTPPKAAPAAKKPDASAPKSAAEAYKEKLKETLRKEGKLKK